MIFSNARRNNFCRVFKGGEKHEDNIFVAHNMKILPLHFVCCIQKNIVSDCSLLFSDWKYPCGIIPLSGKCGWLTRRWPRARVCRPWYISSESQKPGVRKAVFQNKKEKSERERAVHCSLLTLALKHHL